MALPLVSGWCHLGADPVVARSTEGGRLRATFSAAFNHEYDSGGKQVKETTWLRCVAWQSHAAQVLAAELKRGSFVYLTGRLHEQKRSAGQVFGKPELDAEGRKEISQYELTVYEIMLPTPRAEEVGGRQ
jgi:single-stranded DNA-binding protein